MKQWYSALGTPCPRHLETVSTSTVDQALRQASQGIGLVWLGSFPAARRLLDGMRRRLDRRQVDPADSFFRYRQQRRNRTRLLSMLAVPLDARGDVELSAAPPVRDAVVAAHGEPVTDRLLPLRELLGMVSAYEWRQRGVFVPALGSRVHPHYGVFAPTRHDYVDLVAAAPLPATALALDIGTGTGVLAAVLVRRGMRRVIATDVSARAVACARENLAGRPVEVREVDLFPPERAGLVVCNPPWLPATPASVLDQGAYDPNGRVLAGFLAGLGAHLEPGGEGWLVMSDLAERFGLRTGTALLHQFERAALTVVDRLDVSSGHRDEIVSLWRLSR